MREASKEDKVLWEARTNFPIFSPSIFLQDEIQDMLPKTIYKGLISKLKRLGTNSKRKATSGSLYKAEKVGRFAFLLYCHLEKLLHRFYPQHWGVFLAGHGGH